MQETRIDEDSRGVQQGGKGFPPNNPNYKQENLRGYYTRLSKESSRKHFILAERLLALEDNLLNCGCRQKHECVNPLCEESTGENFSKNVPSYCMIRICNNPGCINRRKSILRRKYDAKIDSFSDPRFLTLTLKGHHPLKRYPLDKLNYAWKRLSVVLRKNGYLKSYIKVVEILKRPPSLYYWHVHVVYDGTYIAADVLRAYWSRFTGDSKWVHISRVAKNFSTSAYLRKYITKLAFDDLSIGEYFDIYKMKLISTYGCKKDILTAVEIDACIQALRCPLCNCRLIIKVDEMIKKPPDKKEPLPLNITQYNNIVWI